MNDMAKVSWKDGHQAVELPEGYRFEGEEVRVRREGPRVVLEPRDMQIDEETGLPLETLRKLIQEGLDSGADEPFDAEAIKREARAGL